MTRAAGWPHSLRSDPGPDADAPRRLAANWDQVAGDYLIHYGAELVDNHQERDLLQRFADLARPRPGPVLDLGCGPGHITSHLRQLQVPVIGIDLSPAMIDLARATYPGVDFRVGDLTQPSHPPGSVAGVLLYYSLVNLTRRDVPPLLANLHAALAPGAPLLVAAHEGEGVHHTPRLFGRPISMAITLYTGAEIARHLVDADFTVIETGSARQPDGGNSRLHILAARAGRRTDQLASTLRTPIAGLPSGAAARSPTRGAPATLGRNTTGDVGPQRRRGHEADSGPSGSSPGHPG